MNFMMAETVQPIVIIDVFSDKQFKYNVFTKPKMAADAILKVDKVI